jgi:hypothetical protein
MEGDGAASLLELQASFVDLNLEFRHYPDSRCSELKWQAGKSELIEIERNGHWEFQPVFHLLEWARTSDELIDKAVGAGPVRL